MTTIKAIDAGAGVYTATLCTDDGTEVTSHRRPLLVTVALVRDWARRYHVGRIDVSAEVREEMERQAKAEADAVPEGERESL